MSRPRRYGPARSVRLPLAADEALVERAGDTPVGVYVRNVLLEHLGPRPQRILTAAGDSPLPDDVAKRAAGEDAEARADEIAAAKAARCDHVYGAPIPTLGGKRRCKLCGEMKP